nr:ribonuclease H-like domain-containing protein [Tanacetum cinerariifolium]
PTNTDPNDTTRRRDDEQSRRTVTITTEDTQRKKNDVKARTTLLLSLPDEHQLRFSKYKTLWAVILKTFGGNEATKKRKKNLLKQQYGNFKAEGSETLEQTFNRLQVIVSQLQFMDVEVKKDDLNQKLLTTVAQLEGRLTEYKEREVKYIEKIRTLEMYRASNLKSIKALDKELEEVKLKKDGLDGKLARLLKASKNLDHLIESQRSDQVKEGVGYNAVPPAAADLYISSKKDLSWTGLPEFVDDTVPDYSRPSATVASTSAEGQNKDSSTSEDVASPNPPKPFVKFVKPKDNQSESKTKEQETPKKPQVKYAEQYRHSNKKPKGNQRNWNNLKSYQLGPKFVLQKKPCFNCGDFSHLANDCRRRVQRETTRSQKYAFESPSHRSGGYRLHGGSMRPSYRPVGHRPHGPSMSPRRPTMNVRTQYRAPWVPTVNRNNPPISRKFSTGRRNFPTVTRKFPTASRKFTTGSTKNHTADMGRKGKAVKPSACWTWNPSQKLSNKGPINNSVSVMFKKYTYINTQGRLKLVMAWVPKEN